MKAIQIEDDGIILERLSVDPDSQSMFLDKRSGKKFKQCFYCGERIYEKEPGYISSTKISSTCYVCREAYFGHIRRPSEDMVISYPARL